MVDVVLGPYSRCPQSQYGCGNPARYVVKVEDAPKGESLAVCCGKHLAFTVDGIAPPKTRLIISRVP